MKVKRIMPFFGLLSAFCVLVSCGGPKSVSSVPASSSHIIGESEGAASVVSEVISSQSSSPSAGTESDMQFSSLTTRTKLTATTRTLPTEQGKDGVKTTLRQSDYILNTTLWQRKSSRGSQFVVQSDGGRNPLVSEEILQYSMKKHKLGGVDGGTTAKWAGAGEWSYTFLNLDGRVDGMGTSIKAGWDNVGGVPSSRADALSKIKGWLFTQYNDQKHLFLSKETHPRYSFNGYGYWEHYAGEFDFDMLGAEIGESIAGNQVHMAFTRGAGRQYGKATMIDFSNWYGGGIGNWDDTISESLWPNNGPLYGHTMSLMTRAFMASYMGGIGEFTFEAGRILAFSSPTPNEDALLPLSPYGQTMQKLVAFSTSNPDVGINYTPFGIVLDRYHGMTLYSNQPGNNSSINPTPYKAFGYFDFNAGDHMTRRLIDLWYPGSIFSSYSGNAANNESTFQVNNPYGDTADFLLQTASQKVLNSYPCLILSGDISFTSSEVARYQQYVQQGGTLLMNTAYLKAFPAYQKQYKGGDKRQDITDGKGTVIVYGGDYKIDQLDAIIREQLKKLMPITLSKKVEYLVNVKEGSLLVTVINNDGVSKAGTVPPPKETVDSSKAVKFSLTYTGDLKLKSVSELFQGEKVSHSNNTVSVQLDPGEVKVYEFVF